MYIELAKHVPKYKNQRRSTKEVTIGNSLTLFLVSAVLKSGCDKNVDW